MDGITPFRFEAHEVRVVTGADGAPWFVGADVCAALGLANSRDALARLDADEKGVAIADTLGGPQQVATVSEAGVYRLVFTSRVEGAERFKRWLAHEVLPSIRRTGRYEVPAAAPALPVGPLAQQVQTHMEVARLMPSLVVGLQPAMAVTVALDAIHRDTGITTEGYRKLLPAAEAPPPRLTPTALGAVLGVSAARVNALLAAQGLQRKDGKGWALTEAGAAYGEALPYTRNGHSGYQLLWAPTVVEALRGPSA